MRPTSAVPGADSNPENGWSFTFLLGTDYERKKQRLRQERQLEYKHHLAMEEQKEVRKKQNKFKDRAQSRGAERTSLVNCKVQASDREPVPSAASRQPVRKAHLDPPLSSVNDSGTVTEAWHKIKTIGAWDPSQRRQMCWFYFRPTEPCSSEEEPTTDGEEGPGLRQRRRARLTLEPMAPEERGQNGAKRAPQDMEEVIASGVQDENNKSLLLNSEPQVSNGTRRNGTSSWASNTLDFAIGLPRDEAEDQAAARKKKEQYRQELLKQIAEKQKDKKRAAAPNHHRTQNGTTLDGDVNGTRTHLPHHQNASFGRAQHPQTYQSPARRPHVEPAHHTEGDAQRSASPLGVGELLEERSKQSRQRESLEQQVKEYKERLRREKEEEERLDAKIKAETTAFSPWGRSGGGAPIKDQNGQLISNLTHMHKINMETIKNSTVKEGEQEPKKGDEEPPAGSAPTTYRIPDARHQPTQQQRDLMYKEELRQQIAENRRRREDERNREMMEEERNRERMEEERIRLQRNYEEERRTEGTNGQVRGRTFEPDAHHQEAGRRREPSPPVPALGRRMGNSATSRPSSSSRSLKQETYRQRVGPAPLQERTGSPSRRGESSSPVPRNSGHNAASKSCSGGRPKERAQAEQRRAPQRVRVQRREPSPPVPAVLSGLRNGTASGSQSLEDGQGWTASGVPPLSLRRGNNSGSQSRHPEDKSLSEDRHHDEVVRHFSTLRQALRKEQERHSISTNRSR